MECSGWGGFQKSEFHRFEPELRDFFDLVAGGFEFLMAGVMDAVFEGVEYLVAVKTLDGDDERKAETSCVSGVKIREAFEFSGRQAIEPSAGLLASAVGCQFSRNCEPAGQIGMCLENTKPFLLCRRAKSSAHHCMDFG
jgi:hypothetical protein